MLLQEMEMFYYVIKLGSFTEAAERLEVSKAHISRGVSKLEKNLNVQLIFRSTRKISLTEAGEKLFQHCKSLMQEAEEGVSALSHLSAKAFGTLRITAPPGLGNYILAKFFPVFLKKHPEIKPIVQLENNIVDIVREGFDLALRAAVLEDSQLVAQRVGDITNILCASPGYLEKYGVPRDLNELKNHQCCVYTKNSQPQTLWRLNKEKNIAEVRVQAVFSANQAEILKKMAIADMGIVILQPFMAQDALADGRLVHILPDYTLRHSDLYIVYPSRKYLPKKTKVFIDELCEFLRRAEGSKV
ncbi:MAG: hypothetical protein K0S08_1036 [Gammaproteobacteria bacterium]|jgi:DNA-binding transcriptional LysR family regulator|nr:hypothetical protein [Gammaproteobacteria bacterium]